MNQKTDLIFCVGIPRSGSTLLQHCIGSHPEVATVPEPWIMLPLVDFLCGGSLGADYNGEYSRRALNQLFEEGALSKEDYTKCVRDSGRKIYNLLSGGQLGHKIFLDKTTRYYQIADKLLETFPGSKVVLIQRNPIAILFSTWETNFKGDWKAFFESTDRRIDLLNGPEAIVNLKEKKHPRLFTVIYEELVTKPELVLQNVCSFIGIDFIPEMLDYGSKVRFPGSERVDPKSIYQHDKPVTDYIDSWKDKIVNRQDQIIAKGYLNYLGPNIFEKLGYDFYDTEREIESVVCKRGSPKVPWEFYQSEPRPRYWWQALRRGLLETTGKHGIGHSFAHLIMGLWRSLRPLTFKQGE